MDLRTEQPLTIDGATNILNRAFEAFLTAYCLYFSCIYTNDDPQAWSSSLMGISLCEHFGQAITFGQGNIIV